jgi:hypothetical protein
MRRVSSEHGTRIEAAIALVSYDSATCFAILTAGDWTASSSALKSPPLLGELSLSKRYCISGISARLDISSHWTWDAASFCRAFSI